MSSTAVHSTPFLPQASIGDGIASLNTQCRRGDERWDVAREWAWQDTAAAMRFIAHRGLMSAAGRGVGGAPLTDVHDWANLLRGLVTLACSGHRLTPPPAEWDDIHRLDLLLRTRLSGELIASAHRWGGASGEIQHLREIHDRCGREIAAVSSHAPSGEEAAVWSRWTDWARTGAAVAPEMEDVRAGVLMGGVRLAAACEAQAQAAYDAGEPLHVRVLLAKLREVIQAWAPGVAGDITNPWAYHRSPVNFACDFEDLAVPDDAEFSDAGRLWRALSAVVPATPLPEGVPATVATHVWAATPDFLARLDEVEELFALMFAVGASERLALLRDMYDASPAAERRRLRYAIREHHLGIGEQVRRALPVRSSREVLRLVRSILATPELVEGNDVPATTAALYLPVTAECATQLLRSAGVSEPVVAELVFIIGDMFDPVPGRASTSYPHCGPAEGTAWLCHEITQAGPDVPPLRLLVEVTETVSDLDAARTRDGGRRIFNAKYMDAQEMATLAAALDATHPWTVVPGTPRYVYTTLVADAAPMHAGASTCADPARPVVPQCGHVGAHRYEEVWRGPRVRLDPRGPNEDERCVVYEASCARCGVALARAEARGVRSARCGTYERMGLDDWARAWAIACDEDDPEAALARMHRANTGTESPGSHYRLARPEGTPTRAQRSLRETLGRRAGGSSG